MVNLHFSLLPRWRGAAPVERALLAGDADDRACASCSSRRASTPGPCSPGPRCRSRRATTAAELRAELVAGGHRPAGRRSSPAASASPCRRRARPRTPAKLDADELGHRLAAPGRSSSTGWCGSAARATTFRGQRLKVLAARAVAAGPRRPGSSPGRLDGARVAHRRRQPRAAHRAAGGQGADAVRGVAQRRPARGRRAPRCLMARTDLAPRAAVSPRRPSSASTTTAPTPTSCCPTLLEREPARRARPGLRHRARLRHDPHAAGPATSRRPLLVRSRRPRCARCCASAPTSSLFAGVDPHAAVSTTVDLAPRRAAGFVNAVLAPGRLHAGRRGPTTPPG